MLYSVKEYSDILLNLERIRIMRCLLSKEKLNVLLALRFLEFMIFFVFYTTSGANETIFVKFLSRSSRAIGPKTRVPLGFPSLLITTAALSSK